MFKAPDCRNHMNSLHHAALAENNVGLCNIASCVFLKVLRNVQGACRPSPCMRVHVGREQLPDVGFSRCCAITSARRHTVACLRASVYMLSITGKHLQGHMTSQPGSSLVKVVGGMTSQHLQAPHWSIFPSGGGMTSQD
jgi:hypothetical protein